jgi:dihydrofolate reductase
MSKVRVANFTVSIDGYGAGPEQSVEDPLGRGGEELHNWFLPTRTFKSVHGQEGGTTGVDDEIGSKAFDNLGAVIMGRNMFGPIRGDWADEEWNGWWGDNPPFHVPVFVLTHHSRERAEMEGGTTFHFITGGIEEALQQAREAAGDKDVLIGGGVAAIRRFLQARLIDEMHLAISPILLGCGESLFAGLDLPKLGYRVTGTTTGEAATHVFISRQ